MEWTDKYIIKSLVDIEFSRDRVWVREVPKSGSEHTRSFARLPEGMGLSSGAHCDQELLLNNSKGDRCRGSYF